MRIRALISQEFRFLLKYGIVVIYMIFTILYLGILNVVPESIQIQVAAVLILSDPAAMGLFFMGAVVLLEKSQRIDSALAVSPIRISEYVIAKAIPMAGNAR